LMGGVTFALYSVFRLGFFVMRGSRRRRWRDAMVRRWARSMSRIIGLRATISGPQPSGTFLLVTNHVSYVDILLLASCVDVAFVAKADIRQWPAFGGVAAAVGTIFIDRESRRDAARVAAQIEERLRSGLSVALFPESTSTDGLSVLPFKSTLLEAAARSELPVHHAVIFYEQHEVAWGGPDPLLPHVRRVFQLPRIDARVQFGGSVQSRDRKALARELEREVRRVVEGREFRFRSDD